jgi:hypothetical protein
MSTETKKNGKEEKEEKQVIHEEVVVGKDNIKISSTSEKSIGDILEEAKKIFATVKNAKINPADENGKHALYRNIEKEHKNFVTSLPIISKHMIYNDEFSVNALKRFLKANPKLWWQTEDEWINANVNYIVDIIKIRNPKMDESRIKEYKVNYTRVLKEETVKFKKNLEEIEKEIVKEKQQLTDKKKAEIRSALLKQKFGDPNKQTNI